MSASHCSCPPFADHSCGLLPPGFSRLRYFFGKRLGVADFIDEQLYHVNKLRFHNQALHGAGVLCGLGASLLNGSETVVRIVKGAALDACGREVIVGHDQCIDVDAWYRRERDAALDEDEASEWPKDLLDEDGKLPLCITLRYRECPSHPEPAPRDPCNCAEGGSDYGRVHEEFELRLEPHEPAHDRDPELFPSRQALRDAIADAVTKDELIATLAELVKQGCPSAESEGGLVLACFRAELDENGEGVEKIDDLQSDAPILLSTAVLQELLMTLLPGSLDEEPTTPAGPEIEALSIVRTADGYRFILKLTGSLVEKTLQEDHFRVVRLRNGWDAPPPTSVKSSYDDATGPEIHVDVDNTDEFLEDGGLYRLSLTDLEDPVVNSHMQRLRPIGYAKDFQLEILADGTPRLLPPP